MNINYNQLKAFYLLALHGSVTKAGTLMGISQPAVSQTIFRLESILGKKLFDRLGTKLFLNEYGKALVPKVRKSLSDLEDIQNYFISEKEELRGHFTIGASSTIANSLIPRFLGDFSREYPGVRVDVKVGNHKEIALEVEQFGVDLAFISGKESNLKLETIPWISDELWVFCRPDHPLAGKKLEHPEQLNRQKWVLREKGSNTRGFLEQELNRFGVELEPLSYCEFNSSNALKAAVKYGLGLGCISRLLLNNEIESGEFIRIETPFFQLKRSMCIIHHKKKSRSFLMDHILEYAFQWEQ